MSIRNSGAGYLTTGIIGMPATNANQAISFWFSVGSYSGNYAYINLCSISGSQAVQAGSRSGVFLIWGWGGSTLVAAPSVPLINVLHHVLYSCSSNVHTLYVDGALSNTNSVTNGTGTIDSVQIFGNQWSENITVTLDDVRIYNRPASGAEALTIYTCRGHDAIRYGLVSRWMMCEGSLNANPTATGIKDSANSANHGISFSDASTNYVYTESTLSHLRRT